jgi:hypothetical protein
MNTRDIWEQAIRGFKQAVAALRKARPDDPYDIEIRLVDRHQQ